MSDTATLVFDPQPVRTTFSLDGVAPLPDRSVTFDLGYASVSESYLSSDPPKAEELSAALSVVELHLDDVVRELNSIRSPDDGRTAFEMTVRDGRVIGVGPIFANLAAVELGHRVDDIDEFELTRDAVEDVFRTIATESLEDRLFNPGLDSHVAPVLVGGACLVVEAYRCWGLEAVTVRAGEESVL